MNDSERTGMYQSESAASTSVAAPPADIGRYRVEKILGQGGFGLFYLAHDGQLQRLVAIKVPHHHRVSTTEDAEAYLTEPALSPTSIIRTLILSTMFAAQKPEAHGPPPRHPVTNASGRKR